MEWSTNSVENIKNTYLNGIHPENYAHFTTGNKYPTDVAFACSSRPHVSYPLSEIGKALVGMFCWCYKAPFKDTQKNRVVKKIIMQFLNPYTKSPLIL